MPRRVARPLLAGLAALLLGSALQHAVASELETLSGEIVFGEVVPAFAVADPHVPSALIAAPETAESEEPDFRINADDYRQLLQRLDQLEQAEAQRSADAKSQQAKTAEANARQAHDWVDLSAEKWTVKLGGHVQLDYITWAQADPAITGPAAAPGATDYFQFRRLRLVADGTGYGVYDFRLQMTLEPDALTDTAPALGTTPAVKDAYFTINEIPWVGRIRIGNFFVPFSLEQVTNDTNNIFMERSLPTQGVFAGDRQVGIALYNQSPNQRWTWASGVFFDGISDTLKTRVDRNQGYRASGRVTWLPYYDEPSNGRYLLHTGAGLLHTDDQDNRVRFRPRPQVREGPRLLDSGTLAADSFTTGNLEAALVWGSITLQSEAFLCSVHELNGDTTLLNGMYLHGSWFLTGENRIYERFGQHGAQFGRNVPTSNFFIVPGGASPGAWELKARWSHVDFNDAARGQYNDFTMGCNWYFSDRTRVIFDWIHPITSSNATFGSTQSDLIAMRFDFNW